MSEIKSEPIQMLERNVTFFNLREDLNSKHRRFQGLSRRHKQMERSYRITYYILGCIHVVLSVIVSCLSGALSLNESDRTPYTLAMFIMALIASVLSALLNFIGIEEKISLHHSTAGQYADISKELVTFLLTNKSESDYRDQEMIILEKDKFISSYAPGISRCCGKNKKSFEKVT